MSHRKPITERSLAKKIEKIRKEYFNDGTASIQKFYQGRGHKKGISMMVARITKKVNTRKLKVSRNPLRMKFVPVIVEKTFIMVTVTGENLSLYRVQIDPKIDKKVAEKIRKDFQS